MNALSSSGQHHGRLTAFPARLIWFACEPDVFFFQPTPTWLPRGKKHARLRFRCDYHLNRQGEIAQAGGAGRLKNDGLELAPQIFDIMQHHLF